MKSDFFFTCRDDDVLFISEGELFEGKFEALMEIQYYDCFCQKKIKHCGLVVMCECGWKESCGGCCF